jgi:hypothetical protein
MVEGGADRMVRDLVREMEAVLGRRIEALERQNDALRRNSRLMLGGLCLLLIAALAPHLPQPGEAAVAEVIEARRFVVRDQDGAARGVFGVHGDASVGLALTDHASQERLRFVLLPDGSPGLSFADPRGRSRVVLGLLPDQTASLVFADRDGRGRTVLGISADESSTLVFTDSYGFTRAGLGVNRLGMAEFTLVDVPEEHYPGKPSAPLLAP